ncbi:MAG: hypothetical protein ACXWPM_06010 [Bdellovibrionota bacterium]
MMKVAVLWTGGKDSCLALLRIVPFVVMAFAFQTLVHELAHYISGICFGLKGGIIKFLPRWPDGHLKAFGSVSWPVMNLPAWKLICIFSAPQLTALGEIIGSQFFQRTGRAPRLCLLLGLSAWVDLAWNALIKPLLPIWSGNEFLLGDTQVITQLITGSFAAFITRSIQIVAVLLAEGQF